jgi:hypothetical protein
MKKVNNQQQKEKTSSNKMDGTDNFLDFLSLSVKGLKIIDSPTEFERKYNLEWNLKRLFTAYYEKTYIKDEQQETFATFCDAIKFDMDIWRDYCGITENRASMGIVFNTDGNIEYADGINHLQIYQTEKYGDDDFPYLQLLQHNNFVDLLADSLIYNKLKDIALKELSYLDENQLSFAENKTRETENDFPDNIKNKDSRIWYLETRYALDEIKSSIQGQLLSKNRDIKSFVYLIYLVFSHAGFEINKGTKFSDYLALCLRESKGTIDEYLKDAAKKSLPLWTDEYRKTQRLMAILMQIKLFNPIDETEELFSNSIWEKTPKENKEKNIEKRFMGVLNPEEILLYDQLEIRFK